ncbi:conserved hypothetical protein; putative signal peptide [Bradyrhizobium sp. ORS 278]|uniref:hypothetical protein n=1 Tax=Bradyrhizobium sp. (strain ORS 278) TaxID=114615 RepID=UPI0001508CFB|nr:hypothetical protein [Bradyrhizobium sp. ORS 278]CAL79880.1 conserved hypothetical protein; putative signal peptide [Bradyrhizobium sp. ORS 278]
MKLLVGAVSAALIATIAAAQAEPLPPYNGRGPYRAVSDFEAPYSEAPPPAVVPAPPRYGYGPGADYGYREPRYAPPAPVYRQDGYRDGYQQDYGYAPAFLPVHEVYAVLRDNGFSPLGAPRQRGNVYIVAVLDREGEDGKLVIDARSGRIIRFVPAFQWGEDYERMRFEPRGGLDRLPAPTVIRADPRVTPPAAPRVANAMPAQVPKVPTPVARPAPAPQTAALNPKPAEAAKPVAPTLADIKPAEAKPADVKPVEIRPSEAKADVAKPAESKAAESKAADSKPADATSADTKVSEVKPAVAKPVQSAAAAPQTTGSIAPAATKPAPQILPTAKMPPAQGLE